MKPTFDIVMTEYYDEFCRYFKMAKKQQEDCNLGLIPHSECDINDDLMKNVELYDVVERKYAGFSQIINDIFYGKSKEHPYYNKIQAGLATPQRLEIIEKWEEPRKKLKMEDWIYLFLLHRLTGSAINYGKKPSGYHNTILFDIHEASSIPEMVEFIKDYDKTFYTSIGYQFPKFPKPPKESLYKRGGDYFLCEYVPQLAKDLTTLLYMRKPLNLRDIGNFMFKWNKDRGLVRYKFQYAAFIADIADWFPEYVNRESMFYYGTNAIECISYLAKPLKRMKKDLFLDEVMKNIYEDLDSLPYNAEDVCCDFIRWVENYIRPGDDYNHLDFDRVWSSCKIKDHPFGRQKNMIKLNLVSSFNDLPYHPSDDKVLREKNIPVESYKVLCNQ